MIITAGEEETNILDVILMEASIAFLKALDAGL